MDKLDIWYFKKKKEYVPKNIEKYPRVKEEILYLSEQIRKIADYSLLGEISQKEGKKEISTLIKLIKNVKKELK